MLDLFFLYHQKGMYCNICTVIFNSWQHLKCSLIDFVEYNRISSINEDWYCTSYLSDALPFINIEDDIDYMNCIFSLMMCNNLNAAMIKIAGQFKKI